MKDFIPLVSTDLTNNIIFYLIDGRIKLLSHREKRKQDLNFSVVIINNNHTLLFLFVVYVIEYE